MSKLKLPVIIVVVLAAAGAGLFFSGMVGGSKDTGKKHVIEPVALAEPFVVNLADTDSERFLAFNVAVQLEPMDAEHYATYSGANAGGHGGGGEAPGPGKVATYPKFYDAVMSVAATFTADELKTAEGKQDLKQQLLARFAEIAEQDTAEYKAGAHDPAHVSPPFNVMDVYFTKYVIQ
jgi:flagellar basal body-associated protein FliL